MKKIIKEQVKSQVKAQVTRILPRIEESVNAQLEAEVLTRSSHSSRTSYAVAADLSEMELKKILINKMEGNKSIQKDPPLDQTEGLRDEEKEGSMHQPALHLNQLPGVQAGLLQGLSLDSCLPVSLLLQRNLCRLPVRWRNPHIRCLKQEVYKATTDQLDWDNPEGQQYPHNLLQPLPLMLDKRGRRVIPFEHFITNDLGYLWGGKLSNLTVEERFAFNVSLRMFTRSIVIQRRVEDLQLGVKSYQKRLNLTKPDTYRFDLKRREAYTAYSNPRGFIYQNRDKKNRLMRIDELPKFSDEMLNDVRNALDDRLKGTRMQYLPTTIWRKEDKDRATAMIQAIDKMLKTRRIMISLERFVGGRQYEGDFRMLQRTI
nr:hypothetical protein [Tanacetum cinerariifolium]